MGCFSGCLMSSDLPPEKPICRSGSNTLEWALVEAEVPALAAAEVPSLAEAEGPALAKADMTALAAAEAMGLAKAEGPALAEAEPYIGRAYNWEKALEIKP